MLFVSIPGIFVGVFFQYGDCIIKRTLFTALVVVIFSSFAFGNSTPAVTNVVAHQRSGDSGFVDIYYTLSDADNDKCTISVLVSSDGGGLFDIAPSSSTLEGDLLDVSPGRGHIVWDSKQTLPDSYGTNNLIKLTANDNSGPFGMNFVAIPGGTFQMGDTFSEGYADELPIHTVTLSSFEMSKYETTNGQYVEFLNDAYVNGKITLVDNIVYGVNDTAHSQPYFSTHAASPYSHVQFSDNLFSLLLKAGRNISNDPIVEVSWYGAWAFCDYYGYDLPGEAQWEYAARGGLSGIRFSFGDEISHTQANYNSSSSYAYDINPAGGYHPTWNNDGVYPYTSPVGSFNANGYGLFDMVGNAWEWCNDVYGLYPNAPSVDPAGPATGEYRILRGGSWRYYAYVCRVSTRSHAGPSGRDGSVGFRVCYVAEALDSGLSSVITIDNSSLHIDFSSISDQQAGADFNVTLTVRNEAGQVDTSFTGDALLYVTGGPHLSRTSVAMQDGVWNGMLQLDLPLRSVSITAVLDGFSGTSNVFAVASASNTGSLEGVCVDSAGRPILGVAISVDLLMDGELLATATTTNETTGRYGFTGIEAATYAIEARSADGAVGICEKHSVIANSTTTRNVTLYQSGIPVILVPGIMGSSTGGETMKGSLNEKLDNLEIYNPYFVDPVGWAKLTKELMQKGYEVFTSPWDWRREIDDTTVNCYLKDKINQAKAITGQDKVHVIAHGLGGLLVRYYIQSGSYENDIDKFAMLGTPNGGAAGYPYYLWQAADIDSVIKNDNTVFDMQRFLFNICADALDTPAGPWSTSFSTDTTWHTPQSQVKALIQKNIPGLKHLMLISSPLLAFESAEADYSFEAFTYEEFLTTYKLAHDPNKARLVSGNTEVVNDDQVRTRMFTSAYESTPQSVIVGRKDASADLYPDGVPTGAFYADGDGVALNDSVNYCLTLGDNFDYMTQPKAGMHEKLPKIYANIIVEFLEGAADSQTQTDLGVFKRCLVFEIDGRVQPLMTSPDSQRAGILADTGELVEELSGAISVKPEFSSISVDDPNDGTYMLDFSGEDGRTMTVSVKFAVGDTYYSSGCTLLAGSGVISIAITLDSSNEEPLQILGPVNVVTNLSASPVDGMTLLRWDDPNDLVLKDYRIYGKRRGYRLFELIGETTDLQYLTAHPWRLDDAAELWSYVVVKVTGDGKESFFETVAENRELLIARFAADGFVGQSPFTVNFTDRSSGNPTAWQWDFDADGVVDSTEQNPSWIYAGQGIDTVILTVTSDTGSDSTIRTGYIDVIESILADGVDFSDLACIAEAWLTSDRNADIAPTGGDGVVNILDFALLAENWL